MPELPEVEAIRRGLAPALAGKTLTGIDLRRPELICSGAGLEPDLLIGRMPAALLRRGKYLLMLLRLGRSGLDAAQDLGEDGWQRLLDDARPDDLILTMHFRMTGQLLFDPAEDDAYTHIVFHLGGADGPHLLAWRDVRRFGRLQLFTPGQARELSNGVATLGPEPLSPGLDSGWMRAQAKRHSRLTIGALLLDQTVVAGLGTIYVTESLHDTGISPMRLAITLNEADWDSLLASIRRILAAAVERRGTTFSDFRDANGAPGSYQENLRIYGQPTCPDCGTTLVRATTGGRSLRYCPQCQN